MLPAKCEVMANTAGLPHEALDYGRDAKKALLLDLRMSYPARRYEHRIKRTLFSG